MNATTSDANTSIARAVAHAQGTQVLEAAAACSADDGLQDQHTGRIETAQRAAQAWLALLDGGNFAAVWTQGAVLFRGMERAAWEKSMQTWRVPLGTASARTLHAAKLTRTLPAAPLGEYVLLQFKTRFAHAASVIETVTLLKDEDNTWRVSGYYFK